MRFNNEIASFLLPYVFLHYFLGSHSDSYIDHIIKREFDFIFDIVLNEKLIDTAAQMKEFCIKFLGSQHCASLQLLAPQGSTPKEFVCSAKRVSKLIFEVLDFLQRFQFESQVENRRIKELLNAFCSKTLAEVCFGFGDYQRALIYYESYLSPLDDDEREDQWAFLVHIYAKLGDKDMIAGIAEKKNLPWSAIDKMFIGNTTGLWEDHMVCIEKIIKQPETISLNVISSAVNCLNAYNNCEQAIVVADRMLQALFDKCKNESNKYDAVKSEALLRLSKFEELEKVIDIEDKYDISNWSMIQAKLLLKLHEGSQNEFNSEIKHVRLMAVENFKIFESNQAIYRINYDIIIRLHMLTDIEKTNEIIRQIKEPTANRRDIIESFLNEINDRKLFFKLAPAQHESFLALHRTLFHEIKRSIIFDKELCSMIDAEIGKTWLECANVYQDQIDQASAFLLEAGNYQVPGLFIQEAKLNWKKNKRAQAIKVLNTNCKELATTPNYKKNVFYAKGLLMIARFNGESTAVDYAANKKMYQDALGTSFERDKAYLYFADYLDRSVFLKAIRDPEPEVNSIATDKLLEILEAYGKSILISSQFILQALPRFLQIWLDSTMPVGFFKIFSSCIKI